MIAVIDADLISKRNHNFPNLACRKISGYYKEKGYDVVLKRDYDGLEAFDKVFISKVFTDTPFPDEILKLPNVKYGGTGFFYDKAPNLPDEIEHHMPDYELYDEYVAEQQVALDEAEQHNQNVKKAYNANAKTITIYNRAAKQMGVPDDSGFYETTDLQEKSSMMGKYLADQEEALQRKEEESEQFKQSE